MRFPLKHLFLLASLFIGIIAPLAAQEVILGDGHLPQAFQTVRPAKSSPAKKTTGTAPFPFFDGFSYDSLHPSGALWDMPIMERAPGISISKGIHARGKGVATFDGANFNGRHYDNDDLLSGWADSLTSNAIDLSGKSASDSIYLSFFLEPGGKGDYPEFVDSFYVWFDISGDYEWEKVFVVAGADLPTTQFTPIMIPVVDAQYFRSNFRFKFENFGSLNGELDQWHMDYVYLNQNRTHADTLFNDQSIANVAGATLSGYTRMHIEEYQAGNVFAKTPYELSNMAGASASRNVKVELLDGLGNLSLSGTLNATQSGVSIPTNAFRVDSVGPLSNQTVTDSALFQFRLTLSNPDSRPSNDTLMVEYHIDSVLGYDDGVSDRGYGLTAGRGFCQEFTISQPDTLTGVWINFAPTLYYNGVTGQITSLENKSFKLTVWFDLHPDSILQQRSGSQVEYGDTLNKFFRYTFFEDVPVSGTFWVGIVQVDEMPLGIGFDRNFVNDDKIYFENSVGEFVNTNQGGTLMLRPEFGNKAGFIGVDERTQMDPYSLVAYPNPVQNHLSFRIEGPQPVKQSVAIFRDQQGRRIFEQELSGTNGLDFELPASISAGTYLLSVSGTALDGAPVNLFRQIVVTR